MTIEYLNQLCRRVLSETPEGISKVRFAKVLYFTHKSLVQQDLSSVEQMEFIRMPLGPVPVGFMDLSDTRITVEETHKPELSYDKQVYKLSIELKLNDSIQHSLRTSLKVLTNFQTSDLVEISHEEPSWKSHHNGQQYYLNVEDLKISFPTLGASQLTSDMDRQRLQAHLVEGMLDEIVADSTSLEYPDLKKG
jgi:hypothetical protein